MEEQIQIWHMYCGHVSPTRVRDFKYIQKTDNYYCSWEKDLEEYRELNYRPWQKYAIKQMETQNDREIFVLQDPVGGAGKTTFAKHMVATHKAIYIPPLGDGQDYMAMAMAKARDGRRESFIIDVPRAESLKKRRGCGAQSNKSKMGTSTTNAIRGRKDG